MKALDDGSVLLLDRTYERIVEMTPQGTWKQAIPIPRPGAEWIPWKDFVRLQDGRYLVLNAQRELYLFRQGKTSLEKYPDDFFDMDRAEYIDAGSSAGDFYINCVGYSFWADLKGDRLGIVRHILNRPAFFPEKQALYGVNSEDVGKGVISVASFDDEGKQTRKILWKKRNRDLNLQALSVLSIEPSGHVWIVAAEGKTDNYQGIVRYIARINNSGKATCTFAIPLWYEMNSYWKYDVIANRKGNVFRFRTDSKNFIIARYR